MRKLFHFIVIAALLTASLSAAAFGAESVSAAGTDPLTVLAAADTYVDEAKQSQNFHSLETMEGKKQDPYNRYIYLKFEVPDAAAVEVQTAKLRLYGLSGGVTFAQAYGTSNEWAEDTIAWSNRPDVGSTMIGSSAEMPKSVTQYWDIDVTDYVADTLTAGTTVSIAIQSSNPNVAKFYTKESDHPPALFINEGPPEPTVLVVDQTGAGDFTTIQAALNAANPGDTIELGAGTYVENVTMNRSGTAEGVITVRGADDAEVTLNGSFLIKADYVRVEGFNMVGEHADGTFTGIGFAIKVEGNHVSVVDMDIRSYAGPGIYFAPASHYGYASGNYLYSVAQGFHVASYGVIENNEIEALHLHGNNSAAGDNFRIFGSNIIIRNNYAHGTTEGPHMGPAHVDMFQSWDDTGIDVKHVLIENNVLTGWFHQGIMLENDRFGPEGTYHISDWTVRNNVFSGYESWAISGGGIPNMLVENNIFAGNESTGAYYGVVMIGEGGSGVLRNNIFLNHTVMSSGIQSGATIDGDYNMYWNTVNPASPGPNDITGLDPRFTDAAGKDYTLLSDSPAINTGETRTGFSTDLLGNSRPAGAAWDRGPYEFQGTPSGIAPLITVTAPSFAAIYPVGTEIEAEVNARAANGSIEQVEYYLNGVTVGASAEAPFGIRLGKLAEGRYTLKAVAEGSEGLSGESNEVWFIVTDEEAWVADSSYANLPFEEQSEPFTVAFRVIPLLDGMNGVIGLAANPVSSFGGMAAAVRLNPNGTFDARDGASYAAAQAVPYEQGKSYYIEMAIDLPNRQYDVHVTPEGGARTTVGESLAFRTEQASAAAISRLATIAESGTFMLSGFRLNPEPEPEPEPEDGTPQYPYPGSTSGSNPDSNSDPVISFAPGIVTVMPVTDKDGRASASLTEEQLQQSLGQAEDELRFKLTLPAEAKEANIALPAGLLHSASETSGVQSLTFELGIATVSFPMDQLRSLLTDMSKTMTLTISTVEEEAENGPSSLPLSTAKYVIDLAVDGESIDTLDDQGSFTAAIPYRLGASEKEEQIVVYVIGTDGKPTIIAGGRYDADEEAIQFRTNQFGQFEIACKCVSFDDIGGAPWADKAIAALAARELVHGDGQGHYRPADAVTRAEFVQMLVAITGLTGTSSTSSFTDVDSDAWYAEAVAAAHHHGISNGIGDSRFGVHDPITRQDMAVMLRRALEAAGIELPGAAGAAGSTGFADADAIASYALDSVSALTDAGLLSGMGDGRFAPEAATTRAQAAVLLYRLLLLA